MNNLTNKEKPFLPGEEVIFCGEEATVIKNYGDSGLVSCYGDLMRWYWAFHGEDVKRVKPCEE